MGKINNFYGSYSGFSPSDYDLNLWLDSSDLSTFTKDGFDYVSTWADKSGHSREFHQVSATRQPIWTPNGVDFTSDYMETVTDFQTDPSCTIFIKAKYNALNFYLILAHGGAFSVLNPNGGKLYNKWDNYKWYETANTYFTAGVETTIALVNNGGAIESFKDGVSVASTTIGGWNHVFHTSTLGGNASGFRMYGTLYEVIIVNEVLTAPQIVQMTNYIEGKY